MATDNSPWGASAMQGVGNWSLAPQAGGPPTPSTPQGSTGGTSVPVDAISDVQPAPSPYAPPSGVVAPIPTGMQMRDTTTGLGHSQGWLNNRMDPTWIAQHPQVQQMMAQFQKWMQGQAPPPPPGMVTRPGYPGPLIDAKAPTQVQKPRAGVTENPVESGPVDNSAVARSPFGGPVNAPANLQPGPMPNPTNPMVPTAIPMDLQAQMNNMTRSLAPPPPLMGLPAQNPMAAQMNALLGQQIPGGVQTPVMAGSQLAGVPAANPMSAQMNALLAQQLMGR